MMSKHREAKTVMRYDHVPRDLKEQRAIKTTVYPSAPEVQHAVIDAFLIEKLIGS